jgi:hypothetical protein
MIPRTVNILGREYLVRRKRMKESGLCDFGVGIIYLKSGLRGKDAHDTLLHEIIHGVLHESGIHFNWSEEFTESVVRALEHGLGRVGYKLGGE